MESIGWAIIDDYDGVEKPPYNPNTGRAYIFKTRESAREELCSLKQELHVSPTGRVTKVRMEWFLE